MIWSIHLKPQEDELLSSWIVRLAIAHGIKVHTFCSLVFGSKKQIWNRDIDRTTDKEVLETLSHKTATPFCQTQETLLSSYEGRLFESHNPYGNTPYIMPLGIYHRIHREKGLQFCPECLKESPHYRKQWRLSCAVVCIKHQRLLNDCCPKCRAPVNFHRNELGKKEIVYDRPPVYCYQCQFDLRESNQIQVDQKLIEKILSFQKYFFDATQKGWIEVNGQGPIYSHLYAMGVSQISRLCSTSLRSSKLQFYLQYHFPVRKPNSVISPSKPTVESLDISDRAKTYYWTALLIEDWPTTFLKICQETRTYSSILFSDMKSIPYWYFKVVQENLYILYAPWKKHWGLPNLNSYKNLSLSKIKKHHTSGFG